MSAKPSIPCAWPAELTPDLADILGRQCFMFIKLAQVYRAAGYIIPNKAEAEQAFFLHRFVRAWAEHGPEWRDGFHDELNLVHAQAASAIEARRAATENTDAVHESAAAESRDAQPGGPS